MRGSGLRARRPIIWTVTPPASLTPARSMSPLLLDRLSAAVHHASRGAYHPSPRLREAIEHLNLQLAERNAAESDPPAEEVADPLPARPRVLLYSDASTLRRYVCTCLGAAYTLDDTENVEDHLAHLALARPALLITDLVTLERTDFALLGLRRAGELLEGVPLLLLSQRTEESFPPDLRPDVVLPIPAEPAALREAAYVLARHAR